MVVYFCKILTSLNKFGQVSHPQLERQMSQFLMEKVMLYTFLRAFRADFNHVVFELIGRPKRGQPVLGHPGLSPSVSSQDSNPSLLPKQAGGFAKGALRLVVLYFWPCYHFNNYTIEISSKSL